MRDGRTGSSGLSAAAATGITPRTYPPRGQEPEQNTTVTRQDHKTGRTVTLAEPEQNTTVTRQEHKAGRTITLAVMPQVRAGLVVTTRPGTGYAWPITEARRREWEIYRRGIRRRTLTRNRATFVEAGRPAMRICSCLKARPFWSHYAILPR